MFLKKQIRHQIETELELHFLFNHLLLEDELSRLEKEVSELDKKFNDERQSSKSPEFIKTNP